MAVTQLACPACTAPLPVSAAMQRLTCPYCGSTLQVQGEGEETALRRLDQVADSIRQSSDATHSELRRMQLGQELAAARMQLAQIESEMRAIARGPQSNVSRRQLRDLQVQADAFQRQIAQLEHTLNPDAADALEPTRPVFTGWAYYRWLLFSWRGRLGRAGFWGGMVVVVLLLAVIGAASPTSVEPAADAAASPVVVLLMLLLIWISLSISIKRLHDRGKAGWWVLLGLIPFFGPLYLLVELGLFSGTSGPNPYSG